MQKVSLKKIAIAIVGLLALMHISEIAQALKPVYEWFGSALLGFYDFPGGAQAAIAFFSIILLIVVAARISGR